VSKDNYRLTPRELYELGQRQFEKHDFAAALPHLSELVDKWNVRPEQYKEAVRMLLDIHIEKGPAASIVKYFETVIEKYPDLEVSFDKLVKIAGAYTKLGEYERGYLVFRTTVETSFLKESQVAGVLEDRGQFQRSVDVMSALLRQYPPEAYTASATYALAQRTYAKAPEAAADAKLREQKITRVDLIRRALVMLDGFLTAWPEDPAADQAAFSLASAMLDLDIYQETIDVSKRYVERYPESDYLDSFWYIMAFCHYARGEHDEALAMSQKVADARRRDRASGREIESPNRNRAIYIMGQIYHSLGQAAKAITEYDRVKQYFVDAQQAIDYFQRKEIKLPEVTTFEPGKPAEVELKFRNVAACDTKVYRIDLVKFGLLKRNLEGIRDINLAGIRPLHEEENKLGDGKDYRDRTEKLALPLKEEGAYLVVCRGENLHTSGLVLVSPLKVEVQEDAESGLVRTTVRNVVKDAYVDDVHVKVIGSANDDFIAGETDLRGVFVADQIQGTSTVLARADTGEYAFYRGEKYLGTPPQANQEPAQQQGEMQGKPQQGRGKGAAKEELLEQLRMDNSDIQREQKQELDQFYRNDVQFGAPAEAVLK
jgi:tetratricopeptide (TPR) repeat protein